MSIVLQGTDGRKIVFDGEWLEKIPARDQSNREHVSDFRDIQVKFKPGKRTKPATYEILIACRGFLSLTCDEGQKPNIDELTEALAPHRPGA